MKTDNLIITGLGYSSSKAYSKFGIDTIDVDLLSFFENSDFTFQIEKIISENKHKYKNIHLGCVSYQPEFLKLAEYFNLYPKNLIDIIKDAYDENSIIICTNKTALYFKGYNTYSSNILDSYIYNDLSFGRVTKDSAIHINAICESFLDKRVILGCTDFSVLKHDIKHPNFVDCVDLHMNHITT